MATVEEPLSHQLRSQGEPKRIILLCDGTGNSASRTNARSTNVKRLLDLISPTYEGVKSSCIDSTHEKDKDTRRCKICRTIPFVGQQVVHYQSGVGTSTDMGDVSAGYASKCFELLWVIRDRPGNAC